MQGIKLFASLLAALVIGGTGIALAAQEDSASSLSSTLSEGPAPGSELASKRTATSETFRLPDGALETRIYGDPINYRDAEGDWKPIGEGLEVQPDGSGLTNGPNDFDLALPERMGAEPVRLNTEGGWVSSTFIGADSGSVQLDGSVATYDAANPGTTFELMSISNGVKENIVLAGPSEPRVFHFLLNVSAGLSPELTEQGGVGFRDQTGDIVAEMPPPDLRDSSGGPDSESSEARYELEAKEGGWVLTVNADSSWVSSPERVWPIVIDPTTTKRTLGDDCTVQFLEPANSSSTTCATANATTDQILYKREGETTRRKRAFFQFENLDSLPKNAYITSAAVNLYQSSKAAVLPPEVQLRALSSNWDTKVSWTKAYGAVKWLVPGGDYSSDGSGLASSGQSSEPGWWIFENGMPLLKKWMSHSIENNGLVARVSDESTCSSSCNRGEFSFYNAGAASSLQPYLAVRYYPSAPSTSKLVSPAEGTTSARRLKLKADWSVAGVTGYRFQFRAGKSGPFETIPAGLVRDEAGNPVESWPVAASESRESDTFYFDAAHATPELQQKGGTVQVRVVFDGVTGSEGYSVPVEANINRTIGGPGDAAEGVGPGTLDLLTGNLTVSHADVSLPGLSFSRSFNTRAPGSTGETTVLGQGWKPGVPVEVAGGSDWRSIRLVERTETIEEETVAFNYAVLTNNQGQEYSFEKEGTSYETPPELGGMTLVAQSATAFVLRDSGGNRTTFEAPSGGTEFLPVTVAQSGGRNATQMIYKIVGSQRRLSLIIAPSAHGIGCTEANATSNAGCHALGFSYAPASNWGAPAGYGDRLSKITYYAPGAGGPWDVAAYKYDTSGRLIEEWDPRLVSNPEESKLKEIYTYESGTLGKVTPPGEEPWTLEYTSGTDGETGISRLKAVKRPSLVEGKIAQTSIRYGVPLTGSPYDLGAEAIAKWGQQDLPTDATAIFPPTEVPAEPPSGYAKATVYYMDADGYAVNVASPTPPGAGGAAISTTETDAFGNVVRELTPQNRLKSLEAGTGSATRSHQLETKLTYSSDGVELEEERGSLHQVRLEDGSSVEARFHRTIQYDEGAGTEWSATNPKPHLPTRETTGASIPKQGIDADQRVTEYRYDWDLRKPTETIVDPAGEDPANHLNIRHVAAYDPYSGDPIEVRQPSNPSGGGAGTTKTLYYSPGSGPVCESNLYAGLPCKVYPAAQPGTAGQPQLLVTTYLSYNQYDEPLEVTESPGGGTENVRKTITTYDSAGRQTSRKIEGGGIPVPKVEMLYSPTLGALTSRRFVCASECTGFDSQATATTYDTLGRVTSYEDADGNKAETTYDSFGRPSTFTDGKGIQTRTYDPTSGLLVKLEDSGAGTFTAAYDADGNLVEEGLPDGLLAKTTYDETGQPTHLSYEKKTFCSISCTWLDFGAERSIYGQVLGQTSLASAQQYSYDKAGRLAVVKDTPQGGGCTTRSYTFDADSNRTKLTTRAPGVGGACDLYSEGTAQSYSYDAGDRLIPTGITYDNYGRVTSLPSTYAGGSTLTTAYYTNDLTRSQSQGGITNTYELDGAMRQRTRVQTGGSEPGTEVYHYANGSDSPAWIDRGSSWSRNVAGIGRGLVAIQDSVKGTTLQLTNLHGDVVATANLNPEATKLLASFEFDEFGNPKQGSAGKYGWLGGGERRTELPSGVVQMGVRSYVPAIGRFISTDPISGGSANTYDYANADPVNGLDLGGAKPWDISSVGPCTGDLHVYSPRENRVSNRGGYGTFYVHFKVRCGGSGYVVSVLKVTRRFEQGPGSGNVIAEDVNRPSNPSSSHWNGEWGNWNGRPTRFPCLYGIEYQYTYEIQVQWASPGGAVVGDAGSLIPPGNGTLPLQAQEFCGHG